MLHRKQTHFHGVAWGARGPLVFDLGDALDDYRVDLRLRNDLGVMAIWRPGDPAAELELVGLELDFCSRGSPQAQRRSGSRAGSRTPAATWGTMVERVSEARLRVYEFSQHD